MSCNCCYIICQSQTSETNFTQRLNSPGPISRHSLLTAPWATCMCVLCVSVRAYGLCVLVRILFSCSTRPRRRKEAWHLNNASQPNAENVLPVSSNIISNTVHSFLTCTTTSAQTTHSLCPTPAALQVVHTYSIVPLWFYLCIKILQCTFFAACASSGWSSNRIYSSRAWMNMSYSFKVYCQ